MYIEIRVQWTIYVWRCSTKNNWNKQPCWYWEFPTWGYKTDTPHASELHTSKGYTMELQSSRTQPEL